MCGATENPTQTDVLGIFQLFAKKCGDLGNLDKIHSFQKSFANFRKILADLEKDN
jgi:hypothetical protein